jgi:hypothetical protein
VIRYLVLQWNKCNARLYFSGYAHAVASTRDIFHQVDASRAYSTDVAVTDLQFELAAQDDHILPAWSVVPVGEPRTRRETVEDDLLGGKRYGSSECGIDYLKCKGEVLKVRLAVGVGVHSEVIGMSS